jgi:hypothetical protein
MRLAFTHHARARMAEMRVTEEQVRQAWEVYDHDFPNQVHWGHRSENRVRWGRNDLSLVYAVKDDLSGRGGEQVVLIITVMWAEKFERRAAQ